jgi:hypothetical protein
LASRSTYASRRALIIAGSALLASQLLPTVGASAMMLRRGAPFASSRNSRAHSNCNCVVFLQTLSPVFFGEGLNMNGPDWPQAKVFYAIDPGPEQRTVWTHKLGYEKFLVIAFDPARSVVELK